MHARRLSFKDCVIHLILAGVIFSAALALSFWLIASLSLALQPETVRYQSSGAIPAEPSLLDAILNPLFWVAFTFAAGWCLYRLILFFCKDLDCTGHWGQVISKRGRKRRHP